jgi:putative transposase
VYGCREEKRFLLHAFVIMPEHFHLLSTPSDLISIERCIQLVKGRFSFKLHSRFSDWQPSFTNHRIHALRITTATSATFMQNPVKRGLVRREGDFPYGSVHPGFLNGSSSSGAKAPSYLTVTRS